MGNAVLSESEDEDILAEEMGEAVTNAHKLENPLDGLDASCKSAILKNGKSVTIEHFKVQQLSTHLLKWLMDLMTRNMKQMYKKSAGGWKPKAKRREMAEETSRYLIAFMESKPVAFSHFQFDMDYGREVVYCYEVQVEPDARSFGLGKRIMESLEKIAESANLPMVVLTVFKFNIPSLEFFKRIGYTIDETCPGEEEKKDYVIMSKTISLNK